MSRAIAALMKGATGSFLQTSERSVLRHLTMTMDLDDEDREALTAFLSQGQGDADGYAPQSGQITGILKQMKEGAGWNADGGEEKGGRRSPEIDRREACPNWGHGR